MKRIICKLSQSMFLIVLSLMVYSCTLDERIDDLTGGYEGAFIDKVTGDTVATEYFGAKLKLLDLAYGSVATPLEYKALPEGIYRNTKVFPSDYKVWAEGPFLNLDTIYGKINTYKKMDLMVTPNVTLQIKNIEVVYGITVNVTYSYQVNDERSSAQEIGIVYGKDKYPGFKNAMNEGSTGSRTYKRIRSGLSELSGEFTETIYLSPNSTYYLRALGRTTNAGDYWNYSDQVIIKTTNVDISGLPVEASIGVSSATSAILQWSFPPVVDEILVSYTDMDGEKISDTFLPEEYAYVANLPINTENEITVQLFSGEESGPEQKIKVKTKALEEKYIPTQNDRPENVPFYNDIDFKKSLSGEWALVLDSQVGEDWSANPLRFEFLDWWNTWLSGFKDRMPSCQAIQDFKKLTLEGEIKTLVDILPFINLEELEIKVGENFSVGKTVDSDIDLRVLRKLKKLKKVTIGAGVPLTEDYFKNAGLTDLEIIKQ